VLEEFAGRKVVDRNAMVACGIGRSTIDAAYKQRADTGFPEKATKHARVDYWYADEWERWLADYRKAKADSLSQVSKGGEADDMLSAKEAAAVLGVSYPTFRSGVSRGYYPEADAHEGARPRWKRSTLWATAEARPGYGSPRAGTRKSRSAGPDA
jgi:predicted DNA-binding transcriptional regulator AlpA